MLKGPEQGSSQREGRQEDQKEIANRKQPPAETWAVF